MLEQVKQIVSCELVAKRELDAVGGSWEQLPLLGREHLSHFRWHFIETDYPLLSIAIVVFQPVWFELGLGRFSPYTKPSRHFLQRRRA
jgi:hypothetical protein